jgi:hypothetical protein
MVAGAGPAVAEQGGGGAVVGVGRVGGRVETAVGWRGGRSAA